MRTSECPSDCETGSIFRCLKDRGELYELDGFWVLNAKLRRTPPCIIERTSRPALVIATRRHIERIEDVEAAHMEAFGQLVRDTARELCALSGAERTALLYLNVGTPRHVHAHIVPHFADDVPAANGLTLLERPLPAGTKSPPGVEIARTIAEKLGAKHLRRVEKSV